jgi:TonB family protein
MTRTKFLVTLSFAASVLLATPAFAETLVTFSTAMDAYRSGNFETSFKEIRQLAAAGDARAQLLLGLAMVGATHVPKDVVNGAAWILIAAESPYYGASAQDEARTSLNKISDRFDAAQEDRVNDAAIDLWRDHMTRFRARQQWAQNVLADPALEPGTSTTPGCAGDPSLPQCFAAVHRGLPKERCLGVTTPPDVEATQRGKDVRVVQPEYPDGARRIGWEGAVPVAMHVDRSGYVCRAVIMQSSGYDAIDEAVLGAVTAWRLMPAQAKGQPVESIYFVKLDMMLTDTQKWRATHDAYLELQKAALGR